MALPSLGWHCRRSARLSTLFRYNKLIQTQHVTRRKTPLTRIMSGVMYSSDSERRKQNHKVVVLGIPNPVLWFRTRIYFFLIRAYFDKDFDTQEFTDGAKQAFSHVSRLISQCQFEALEGLVAENLIGKLEEQCATLPLNYKRALSAEPDEIMYTLPGDVGFYYDNGRKFVSILMRFWYLTSSRLPDETAEGARIFQVAIGGNGQKPESKRLLTANYEFQREFTQGVTPDWTITRIEHSTWLKL